MSQASLQLPSLMLVWTKERRPEPGCTKRNDLSLCDIHRRNLWNSHKGHEDIKAQNKEMTNPEWPSVSKSYFSVNLCRFSVCDASIVGIEKKRYSNKSACIFNRVAF